MVESGPCCKFICVPSAVCAPAPAKSFEGQECRVDSKSQCATPPICLGHCIIAHQRCQESTSSPVRDRCRFATENNQNMAHRHSTPGVSAHRCRVKGQAHNGGFNSKGPHATRANSRIQRLAESLYRMQMVSPKRPKNDNGK